VFHDPVKTLPSCSTIRFATYPYRVQYLVVGGIRLRIPLRVKPLENPRIDWEFWN